MRILLIGNFAPDRQESMLRFAHLLSDGLQRHGHEVEVWSPEPATVRYLPHYRYGGAAKYLGYFDKFIVFPRRVRARLARATARGELPDVVHIVDHANAVYAPLFRGLRLLATCHDLLQIRSALGEFSERRLPARAQHYQRWILDHIRQLPLAVCVSQKTRDDLQRIARLPDERLRVIHNGLNHAYGVMTPTMAHSVVHRMLRDRGLPSDRLSGGARGFLLNVGGGQWYKNRRGLLELYAEFRKRLIPPARLVMVGKPLAPELATLARTLGLSEDLIELPGVSEEELEALYNLADALIFPSWEEGFGWPVAEAQACGCPVFASNRAPMTEVGGDGAEYFDPADPVGAAEKLAAAWPRRRSLVTRGFARADLWHPRLMCTRYLEAYESLVAGAPATTAA